MNEKFSTAGTTSLNCAAVIQLSEIRNSPQNTDPGQPKAI